MLAQPGGRSVGAVALAAQGTLMVDHGQERLAVVDSRAQTVFVFVEVLDGVHQSAAPGQRGRPGKAFEFSICEQRHVKLTRIA